MTVRILGYLVLLLALTSMPAYALDLHEARDAGLVAEKLDGYVAPLKATPEVEALVQEVNAKRKQEYARISAKNSQPVDIVAKLAAEQIIRNLDPGSYYQASDGTWKTR
jgi:uncharacterized protein YdbL (DUF1318 family)